jgi:hypothetical protein
MSIENYQQQSEQQAAPEGLNRLEMVLTSLGGLGVLAAYAGDVLSQTEVKTSGIAVGAISFLAVSIEIYRQKS